MIRTVLIGLVIIGALIYIARNPSVGGTIGADLNGLFTAFGNFLSGATRG